MGHDRKNSGLGMNRRGFLFSGAAGVMLVGQSPASTLQVFQQVSHVPQLSFAEKVADFLSSYELEKPLRESLRSNMNVMRRTDEMVWGLIGDADKIKLNMKAISNEPR